MDGRGDGGRDVRGMTGEQLRASILQMAMQGKLVEQREEEGTGEELYREILAEKRRLEKEGKIKPGKKYSAISEDEIPFDIPDSWMWVRLSEIVFNRGQKKPERAFSYIDIGSIDNVHQRLNKEENIIKPEDAPSRARKIVERGDVIYSTVRPYLHNMCIINRDFSHEPIASTGFATMTCHKGFYNKFLFYFLLSPGFDSYANDTENSKGVAYPAINDQKLYKATVPLPPLSEQERIVAKIEELMPLVEVYTAKSEKLNALNSSFPEMMKKSILREAVQGRLVPQDPNDEPASVLLKKIAEEKKRLIREGKIKKQKPLPEITEDEVPFEVPDGWEWARWGAISESIQYGYNTPAKISGRIKMIRITDIHNNSVRWDTVPFCEIADSDIPDYLVKDNDILFARTGGTVGKSILVKDVKEDAIYAGYLIRTRYSKEHLCPEYLKAFMESDLYWRQLRSGIIATAQPNCNGQTLSKMIIPIPPINEQYRIVKKINSISAYFR